MNAGTGIDLQYSDVEDALRASVRDLLTDRAPWNKVLARTESDEPYDPSLWSALAGDLGAAGLPVPESAGGQGATWREAAVVAEELGRSMAASPFLGSAVLATVLAGALAGDAAAGLVAALGRGAQTAALAVPLSIGPGRPYPSDVEYSGGRLRGTVRSVADALGTDVLLVPARESGRPVVVAVPAANVGIDRVVALDETRPLADLQFDDAAGDRWAAGDDAERALAAALTAGAVLLAAEQVGLAQRCLELTVDHLGTRHQFGRPIGSFQALKHRAADVWAAVSQARAVSRYAAACLADDTDDLAVAASLAQAYCSGVAVLAAEECVQLHGGIGFTWEHPAHLYLKRAKADALALGTAASHRTHLGTLVELPPA